MTAPVTPEEILEFWFADRARALWFNATPEFDLEILERFGSTWEAGAAGELDAWGNTPRGALALVILLDQFPLNMFRGKVQSFSTEAAARRVASGAIERGFDTALTDMEKALLYLPFMHSEELFDQDRSVALFEAAGLTDNLKWARHHRDIIRRFGRFPHRNAILGRTSTSAELAYLDSPDAFHG